MLAASLSSLACPVATLWAQSPSLPPSTVDAVQMAASADVLKEPYRLGRGDVISVHVENRPEISSRQPVGPDGCVTVSLVGSIPVVDLTREEAAAKILAALQPYYTTLSVTVSVETYGSNKVLLLGAVAHPGPQNFDSPPTLLEVLSGGGGLHRRPQAGGGGGQSADPNAAAAMPDKAVIYRGSNTVMWVDVKKMVTTGTSMPDIYLKRDDVVYVPSSTDRSISVMGQVQRPGNVPLEDGERLQSILADAGGLTDRAGKNPTIRILQPATGKSQEVAFQDLLQGKPLEVMLHPGDLVFVPMSTFNSMSYVIEKMSPLVNVFTTALIANR